MASFHVMYRQDLICFQTYGRGTSNANAQPKKKNSDTTLGTNGYIGQPKSHR